jgi:hypothetical protein
MLTIQRHVPGKILNQFNHVSFEINQTLKKSNDDFSLLVGQAMPQCIYDGFFMDIIDPPVVEKLFDIMLLPGSYHFILVFILHFGL